MGILHSILLLIVFITLTYRSGSEIKEVYPYEESLEEEFDQQYEEVQFEEDVYAEEEEESSFDEDYSEEQPSEI